MFQHPVPVRALLSLAALFALRCGAGAGLRAEFARISTFPRPEARGDHLAVSVSPDALNALLAKLLERRPLTKRVGFPEAGLGFTLSVASIRVEPAARCADCVKVRAAFDVAPGTWAPVRAELGAELPIQGTIDGKTLRVGPLLSRARSISVRWPDGWSAKLSDWLTAHAPTGLLRAIARNAVATLAPRLSGLLIEGAKGLLALAGVDIDSLARVSVPLPALKPGVEVPVKSFRVASNAGSIAAVATLTCSVTDGPLAIPRETSATGVTIVVRGQALLDAIQFAMARGIVPERYDQHGKPKPDGDFRVSFEWGRSAGSIRVHFWKLSAPAGVATLEGRFAMELTPERRLAVKIEGLKVVEKRGDFLFELGVWLKSELWGKTHDVVKSFALPATIRIGDRTLTPNVRELSVIADGIVVSLDPGPPL